jgi:hypothetical protein
MNEERQGEPLLTLPHSYYLAESDLDIVVLRRQDGSFVAAFSAQGAAREGIREATEEDYSGLPSRRLAGKDSENACSPEVPSV